MRKQQANMPFPQFANVEAAKYLSIALDLTLATDTEHQYQLLLSREQAYALQGRRRRPTKRSTYIAKFSNQDND